MLFLLFQLGEEPYAVDVRQVEEVLPVVEWKPVPQTVEGILGVINYHGQMVPLLDLSQFVVGSPTRLLMNTRIVLFRYSEVATGGAKSAEIEASDHWLGLLAENATRTFQGSLESFSKTGIEVENAPYLGPVVSGSEGIVQLLDLEKILPPEAQKQLIGLSREKE